MKKTVKISLYILLTLVLIIPIGAIGFVSYWRTSSTIDTFPDFTESTNIELSKIEWKSGSLGDTKIDKIAFFVPVKIEGLDGNLFMQFDTGTSKTVIYGKTLDAISNSKSSTITYYNNDSIRYFKNPRITIGSAKMIGDKIKVLSKMGKNTQIDSSFIVIGTIGFDAVVGRTLILDFKNNQFGLTRKSSDSLDYSLDYVDEASVDRFPFLVPVKIGNVKTKLFYDTGSSMFPILTSNKKLQNINKNNVDTLCCVSNWGRKLPVFRKEMNMPIVFGNSTVESKYIYSAELLDNMDYSPNWFLFGMTGNKIFNDKIIVIDTKNNRFGIEE